MSTSLYFVHFLNWSDCQSLLRIERARNGRRISRPLSLLLLQKPLWEAPSLIPAAYNCKFRKSKHTSRQKLSLCGYPMPVPSFPKQVSTQVCKHITVLGLGPVLTLLLQTPKTSTNREVTQEGGSTDVQTVSSK